MKNKQNKVLQIIDSVTMTAGKGLQTTIANLGIAFLPLISGALYSFGIYRVFLVETESELFSVIAAIIAAIGLESIGYASSKLVIKKPNILTVLGFAGYILVGGGTLFFTDINHSLPLLTASSFLLTAISYGLYGMNEKLNNEDAGEADTEQMIYDRKQSEKQTRFENKLTVEKLKGLGKDNVSSVSSVSNASNNVSYKTLTQETKDALKGKTVEELQAIYPSLKKRTAYNWVNNLKENK